MTVPLSFTIVVPAYNVADTIGDTLVRIRQSVNFARDKGAVGTCDVIVVDDRSTDDSVAIALAYDTPDLPVRA